MKQPNLVEHNTLNFWVKHVRARQKFSPFFLNDVELMQNIKYPEVGKVQITKVEIGNFIVRIRDIMSQHQEDQMRNKLTIDGNTATRNSDCISTVFYLQQKCPENSKHNHPRNKNLKNNCSISVFSTTDTIYHNWPFLGLMWSDSVKLS